MSYLDGLELNILNITNLIDCLDEEQSLISYFKNSKKVKQINQYIFKPEILESVMLFKITQLSPSYLFGTDNFYFKVQEYNLTVLKFKLVCST